MLGDIGKQKMWSNLITKVFMYVTKLAVLDPCDCGGLQPIYVYCIWYICVIVVDVNPFMHVTKLCLVYVSDSGDC